MPARFPSRRMRGRITKSAFAGARIRAASRWHKRSGPEPNGPHDAANGVCKAPFHFCHDLTGVARRIAPVADRELLTDMTMTENAETAITKLDKQHDLHSHGYKFIFKFEGETHFAKSKQQAEDKLLSLIERAREVASAKLGLDKMYRPDAWENDVRRFCLVNKSDEKQKDAAYVILEDCRKDAEGIMEKIKDDVDAEKDKSRREKLLEPIGKVFEDKLMPGLNDLLSAKQKKTTAKPKVKKKK